MEVLTNPGALGGLRTSLNNYGNDVYLKKSVSGVSVVPNVQVAIFGETRHV